MPRIRRVLAMPHPRYPHLLVARDGAVLFEGSRLPQSLSRQPGGGGGPAYYQVKLRRARSRCGKPLSRPSRGRETCANWAREGARCKKHGGPPLEIKTPAKVHRLVWEAFNQRLVPRGLVVDHVNGNSTDNRIENLRVIPQWRNAARGDPAQRMDTETKKEILWCVLAEGMSFAATARQIGCSRITVSRVVHRATQENYRTFDKGRTGGKYDP